MGKPVSAADANRDFSKLLRGVRDGESYVITSHGKPVAKLVPADARDLVRDAAKRALIARLRAQRAGARAGRWTRDELYDT
ncbi:MAG TPA: type II toxin-antitoxin system prevent-host-death family antitoxin [Vicinamibacterales bacterium]|nr:type II toxin-antitoxin system prevent-host-death family antitoxin [Vicinamibacterales bacterium]